MGKIRLLDGTTERPLEHIGKCAGICWGADTSDENKNIERAKNCILSGHGRVLEYVDIELVIEGYSARVIREWYTHIAGGPTRLQESTRYVSEQGFDLKNFVTPNTVAKACFEKKSNEAAYNKYMNALNDLIFEFKNSGVPKEDIAMFYPLGMTTKIVDKRNLRNFADMCGQRLCSRAYWEYRKLMAEIISKLREVSDEWCWIADNLFIPKCEKVGFCVEDKCCGRKPKIGE